MAFKINQPAAQAASTPAQAVDLLASWKQALLDDRQLTLTELGLTDLTSVTMGALFKQVAEYVLYGAHFHACEIRALMGGHGSKLDTVGPELSEFRFKRAMRRVAAGYKVLPQVVLDAFDGGKLFRGSALPAELRRAFGALELVSEDDVVATLSEGGILVVEKDSQRTKLLAKVPAAERSAAAIYTPERLILEAFEESKLDLHAMAKLLERSEVRGDVLVGFFGDYGEVEFDYAKGALQDQVIHEKVRCQGREIPAAMVLSLFALSLESVSKLGTAEAKVLAAAPSIFEEPEYDYTFHPADGEEASRPDLMKKFRLGFLSLKATYGSLCSFELGDNRTVDEVVAGAESLANQGIPVCIDKVAQNVLYGKGALAAGFGLEKTDKGYMVVNFHDQSKLEKALSRYGLTKPTARLFDPVTGQDITVPSGLHMDLGDGTTACAYGRRTKMLLTNGISFGSGIFLVREDFLTGVDLTKNVRADLNGVYLDGEIEALEKANPGKTYGEYLTAAASAKIGVNPEAVEYGGTVLSYDGLPLSVWDGYGLTAKADPKGLTMKVRATSETLSLSVPVSARYVDPSHKMTCNGFKGVSLAYPFEVVDVNTGEVLTPEAIANNEVTKGLPTLVTTGYADTEPGGLVYNPNTGLTPEQIATIQAWATTRTRTVDIKLRNIDREAIKRLQACIARAKADPTWAERKGFDPDAFSFPQDGVVVMRCEALECELVLGVEVSTTRENITWQPGIAEQLVVLRSLNQELGDGLWKQAAPTRKAVESMLAMALDKKGGGATVPTNRPTLTHDRSLKGRDLLKHYAKEFKDGLTFATSEGKAKLTLNFQAFLALGAITPSGSATGVALAVIELLDFYHVANAGKKGWSSHINRKLGKVNSALEAWSNSNGPLGKVTKTNKVFAGAKVRTTLSRTIREGQVGINPQDPRVLNGLLNERDFVLSGRSPMVSVIGSRYVLTEEAPIGTTLVKAVLWAYGNEGDSDGDPEFDLLIKSMAIAIALRKKLRHSLFGPMGYLYVHGTDVTEHPYTAFYLENGKKSLRKEIKLEAVRTPLADYLGLAKDTGDHYSFFVGKTFAIVSYLTLLLGRDMDKGKDVTDLEKACVIAWRVLYEGLGLAGYTPTAKTFRKHLGEIFRKNLLELTASQAKKGLDADFPVEILKDPKGQEEPKYQIAGHAAFELAWFLATGRKEENRAITGHLYNAVLVTGTYSELERELEPGRTPEQVMVENQLQHAMHAIDHALIFGTLRRGSKGLAVSAATNEDEDGNGLYRWVAQRPKTREMAGNGLIREMLDAVVSVQMKRAAIKQRAELLSEFGA